MLRKRGFFVYPPNFRHHFRKMIVKPEHVRLRSKSYENRVPALAYHHFQNLIVASKAGGVCFTYNSSGYIGPNTLVEMGIAMILGMPVFALMPHKGKIADFASTKKNIRGEILINKVLISEDGTFLKRPSHGVIDPREVCEWLEQRVK